MKTLSLILVNTFGANSYVTTHIKSEGEDLVFYDILTSCPIRLVASDVLNITTITYTLSV